MERYNMAMHTTLRDTVLQGLSMWDTVRADDYPDARCTIVGWAAADPFGPATVQLSVENFDTWGRVVHVESVHVARDTVRAWQG